MRNSFDTEINIKDCSYTVKATGEQINDGFEVRSLVNGDIEYSQEGTLNFYTADQITNLKFKEFSYEKELNQLVMSFKKAGSFELNNFKDIEELLNIFDSYLPHDLQKEEGNKIIEREINIFYVLAYDALEKEKLLINNL